MNNNFDAVRLGLSLIVVLAHVGILTGVDEFSEFIYIFNSFFAVKAFFAISGFLVGLSYLSCHSILEYAQKRAYRIFPAYIATIFFCIFVGALVSTLSIDQFLMSPDTRKYFFANLSLLNFLQPTLPGVFTNNLEQVLNGSLWTIKVEVMLYFCIPLLIFLFKKYGSFKTSIFVFLLSIAWVWYFEHVHHGFLGREIARQFPGQLAYFIVGLFLALNQKLLPKLKIIALVSFVALFIFEDWRVKLFLDPIGYSSIVLYLATSALRSLDMGKFGDISYGIYLYHFPIIQLLIYYNIFQMHAWLGLFLALFCTILMAFLSWHFLEKNFLHRNLKTVTVRGV